MSANKTATATATAIAPGRGRASGVDPANFVTGFDATDTIVAIASPGGPGLRGMVRLTGPEALAIALDRWEGPKERTPPTKPERRVGRLRTDGLRRPLAAAVALWPGSQTYTGQPLAEVHVLGSPPLLRLILSDYLGRGARLAEPGEFTLRAFLSGRIDLTQSEAVLGVIDATTPSQLDEALRQLGGGLTSPIRALRDRLADVLAHLEANLDFSEEPDVDLLGIEALARSLDHAAAEVQALADRLKGRYRSAGRPRVVLVGPPNAGKSRLFNALVGQGRAIVSPVAGSTRDYLEAPCDCGGLLVDLVDTAGMGRAFGPIEAQAQDARASQAELADLLLDCRSEDVADEISNLPANRLSLRVGTKADIAPISTHTNRLATSASTGEGLAALRRAIAHALRSKAVEGDLPAGTAARCGESLANAGRSLATAAETLRLGGGGELVAVDLRNGLDDLGRVVGAIVTDDLLDRIFRRFCIGK